MSQPIPRGRFVWYELLTSDPGAAKSFYTGLTGWGTSVFDGGTVPYTMWVHQEMPLGGVMQLPEEAVQAGAPPHWSLYIATPDVDATAARAKELGGSVIVEPLDLPTVGRFAILADPQGATFHAFAPEQGPEDTKFEPQVGEVSWHELATTDHEAALKFYTDLFSWDKTETTDMGELGIYQMYGRQGVSLGGMFNKPAEMPGPPAWLLYVRVADIAAAVEQVKAQGGQVLNGPMEVPGGDQIAQCMDPQGAAFALHSTG